MPARHRERRRFHGHREKRGGCRDRIEQTGGVSHRDDKRQGMMSYLRPDADRQGGGPAFYQTAGCISDHGRALLAMHQPEHRHAGQHNARRRGRHHPDGAGAEGPASCRPAAGRSSPQDAPPPRRCPPRWRGWPRDKKRRQSVKHTLSAGGEQPGDKPRQQHASQRRRAAQRQQRRQNAAVDQSDIRSGVSLSISAPSSSVRRRRSAERHHPARLARNPAHQQHRQPVDQHIDHQQGEK